MYSIGYDIGSSSVKALLLDLETGLTVASAYSPKQEMPIIARHAGWAEQDPESWWKNLIIATDEILTRTEIAGDSIVAVGISYQMHGLVVLDKSGKILRPSIIWCDSRAVENGQQAFLEIGRERCLDSLLNSPGNFTAAKLRWVQEHEPDVYSRIYKFMLPGDYVAYRLTGEMSTSISGLSEGILWDFKDNALAKFLLNHWAIEESLVCPLVPTFGVQGHVTDKAAEQLGIPKGIPVSYRAGDQPNNAFSLNVLEPGEIAATAGTSGVVYGVSDSRKYDQASRVNSFVHVNHNTEHNRIGVLLCINGTGIANSWFRRILGKASIDYSVLNEQASGIPIGSSGITVLPFGNGTERMLENRDIGGQIVGLNFNIHSDAHLARAVQEGIACAFRYGLDIMRNMQIKPRVIRAGLANMFLSSVFCESLANTAGVTIELYNTDGAQGAARGAAVGSGFYPSFKDAFRGLARIQTVEPDSTRKARFEDLYAHWAEILNRSLGN